MFRRPVDALRERLALAMLARLPEATREKLLAQAIAELPRTRRERLMLRVPDFAAFACKALREAAQSQERCR